MGKSKSGLAAPPKAVDPTLDALFSTSAGPVKTPPKSRYAELLSKKAREESPSDSDEDEDDEDASELEFLGDLSVGGAQEKGEGSSEGSQSDSVDGSSSADEEAETVEILETSVSREPTTQDDGRKRKRKQRDEYDNLESKYLQRLADEGEPSGKRLKADGMALPAQEAPGDVEPGSDSDGDDVVPAHESLADPAAAEVEKANRTVFLSNVSAEAITSRTAKKTLLSHLGSVLDKAASPPQKIESIRFRSTAFSTAAVPKRAAYIKKSVMEATTKSTNAYVVYSSPSAARLAVAKLNGTMILDRHLRVDSVAHPAAVDHRRCVFVGNLGFVDDESLLDTKVDEEGNKVTEKKKRTRTPMDVEEGLWRVFGKESGKVEGVRVVRDPVTRVGKGFAYVQFYDSNAVESAVLLNGKKFPPMLPRELRVSRCKAPHKTARAMEAKHGKKPMPSSKGNKNNAYVPKTTTEDKTLAGRAAKLLGRAAAGQLAGAGKKGGHEGAGKGGSRRQSGGASTDMAGKMPARTPEDIVFEGRRASAKDGRPKDLKFKGSGGKSKAGGKKGPKPTGRGAVRAAKWRANGAK